MLRSARAPGQKLTREGVPVYARAMAKRPEENRDRATRGPAASPETLMRTCPICGRELLERKCKLFCPDPRCAYFLSCSDFY